MHLKLTHNLRRILTQPGQFNTLNMLVVHDYVVDQLLKAINGYSGSIEHANQHFGVTDVAEVINCSRQTIRRYTIS